MYISVEQSYNRINIVELINEEIVYKEVFDFKPCFFIEDELGEFSVLRENKKVKPIYIDFKDYYNVRNSSEYMNIKRYNDISPKYQYISKFYYGKKELVKKFRHHHLDIEVTNEDNKIDPFNAKFPITLMQIFESDTKTIYLFGLKEFNDLDLLNFKNYKVVYFKYDNDKDLLLSYINFVKERNPITTNAWFGYGFDFPYIVNRCKFLNIDYREISPYKMFKKKSVSIFGNLVEIEIPMGRYWLDSKEVYEYFSYGSRESYSLEFIAQFELGKGKIKFKNFSQNLNYIYNNDYKLFIEYGIQDVILLYELELKLDYLNIMINQAWDMGVNFDDVFSTVKPWTYKLYNELNKFNIVMPINENITKEDYIGAFILAPTPGKYEYLITYDIRSEYPSAIVSNNISYETIVEDVFLKSLEDQNYLFSLRKKLKNNSFEEYLIKAPMNELKEIKNTLERNNLVLSPSGEYFFRNQDGILPNIVKKIFEERILSQEKAMIYSKILELCKEIKNERN